MRTARGVLRPVPGGAGPGERQRRRFARRRLLHQEVLAVVILAAALAVTLVLLGLQWLDAGAANLSLSPNRYQLLPEVVHEAVWG